MSASDALRAAVMIAGAAAAWATSASTSPAHGVEAKDPPLRLSVPVAGVHRVTIRNTFKERRSGDRAHEALDIPAARGTPVLAAAPGRIVKLFTSNAGGLTIYEFERHSRYALYYAHLDRYAEGIREGKDVERGEVIGYVGTTGNAPADAPHLHFAVFRLGPGKEWWKGTPVDAFDWLSD